MPLGKILHLRRLLGWCLSERLLKLWVKVVLWPLWCSHVVTDGSSWCCSRWVTLRLYHFRRNYFRAIQIFWLCLYLNKPWSYFWPLFWGSLAGLWASWFKWRMEALGVRGPWAPEVRIRGLCEHGFGLVCAWGFLSSLSCPLSSCFQYGVFCVCSWPVLIHPARISV